MTAMRTTLVLALVLATALPALADGAFPGLLSPADRQRLSGFEAARTAALSRARDDGATADLAALNRALEGKPTTLRPAEIAGDWRCRSIQMGSDLSVVAYGEFRCRITDDGAGLTLRKLNGSQRTNGTFYDIGEARLGYAGALTYNNDPTVRYGQDTERDQAGYLVPVSRSHLRLELPGGQGNFEIIDFRR